MNYPPIIKGVWNAYSTGDTNNNAIIPIEDIEKFTLKTEAFKNGVQVVAFIKTDLVDSYRKHTNVLEEKKYRLHQTYFTIRGKDMPKFRKEIHAELQKAPTIVTHHGINGGTSIAQSFTFARKELKN